MKERVRLSKEERKKQICNIARKLFVERGLENTTMKDIMQASGISVGGLYHHYQNIYDVLKDTIIYAEDKKNNMLFEIKEHNPEMAMTEIIIETLLTMLFDQSDYSVLYVLLLVGMKKNDSLRMVYEERKIRATKDYLGLLKQLNIRGFECLAKDEFIDFFNVVKIGTYYFNNGGDGESKKRIYSDFIRTYINQNRDGQ